MGVRFFHFAGMASRKPALSLSEGGAPLDRTPGLETHD